MKMNLILLTCVIGAIGVLIAVSRVWRAVAPPALTFAQECLQDGNMWHTMTPLKNGVPQGSEKKPGCMTMDGMQHFVDRDVYERAKDPGESTVEFTHGDIRAGKDAQLHFTIRNTDGSVPDLFREHERFFHIMSISGDMALFSHIHPEDQKGFSSDEIMGGEIDISHTFEREGRYIVAVDYANQLRHESRFFTLDVGKSNGGQAPLFPSPQLVGPYSVALDTDLPLVGRISTLRFHFEKDGKPVTDLEPYLGAALHLAIVKNDLSEFVHTHGEVHGANYVAPANVHVHTPPPAHFGPDVEAHPIFPSAGDYTVIVEFKHKGAVRSVRFTVRVEE